jgi:pilus assembly protein CpaB
MSIFKNRTVIGIICILVALVICFGVTPLFNQGMSKTAEVLCVSREINAGDVITKDMIAAIEVGSYNLPENIISDPNSVIGKYAAADLSAGDYILPAKLVDSPAAENAYLYHLDGTKQAMSVTIKSFATGLSGKLQSGDIVSVIVADYQGSGQTVTPAELQYVEIISVTASTGYDANTGHPAEDEKELPSTATFLVLPQQAKVLAELEQDSTLHLALVYRGAAEHGAEFIAAQDALIEEMYADPEEIKDSGAAEGEDAPMPSGLSGQEAAQNDF